MNHMDNNCLLYKRIVLTEVVASVLLFFFKPSTISL